MLLSIFSQLQGVPPDYSCEYFRRAMAFHVASDPEAYQVTIITQFLISYLKQFSNYIFLIIIHVYNSIYREHVEQIYLSRSAA